MRLNSWKTKFSQNATRACSQPISIDHIIFHCPILKSLFEDSGFEVQTKSTVEEISHSPNIIPIATIVTKSVINVLL